MRRLLEQLLTDLEIIGNDNEELYDSEVRTNMSKAILETFVKQNRSYVLPTTFGMNTEDGDRKVRDSLARFIDEAIKATQKDRGGFHQRLAMFQDEDATSQTGSAHYDDFFGYWRAHDFDDQGNAVEH